MQEQDWGLDFDVGVFDEKTTECVNSTEII